MNQSNEAGRLKDELVGAIESEPNVEEILEGNQPVEQVQQEEVAIPATEEIKQAENQVI